jgi:hypothetical protein
MIISLAGVFVTAQGFSIGGQRRNPSNAILSSLTRAETDAKGLDGEARMRAVHNSFVASR